MSEALVSVVVPTFNRAYCLGNALDSALAQSHRNIELIVIDDGSTDSTPALLSEKYGNEPRVKYFRQANQGVTAARNQGLNKARGDFIALLDSDDRWQPWKLAAQLACMARFPEVGMAWTDMRAIDPAGKVLHNSYLHKMYSCWRQFTREQLFEKSFALSEVTSDAPGPARVFVGDVYAKMFLGSLVHTSTVLLTRERFEKVKGFNESLKVSGEDYDFHLRTCREGPVAFIDVSSIDYKIGMADCLTRNEYEVEIASNTLRTIELAYERDRDRIALPGKLIRRRFAGAHAWAGEALLDVGRRGEARGHFVKSLGYQPLQLRTARLLALAAMPNGAGRFARSIYRRTKRRLPGARSAQQGAA